MATIIDELMITLGIDGKEAKKGMQDVTNSIKGSMQNITSTLQGGFASVSKIFTGFGAAIMGAFSVGSAFSTWKEQAAELGGVSKRLKMSIEDVQGWTGAIGKFGGSAQDFEGTLRGLNGQLARMATIGKSRAGTLLQSLGIDAGEVGRQRNALAVLEDLAGVMEQMAPDEARGIGAALGLDPSTIMLLQQGRDGMKDLIRQKKEDAVYTQEDADAVKAYSVEMGKLKKGFMGIMGVLFRAIMPAFTMVTKYIGQFVNYLRKHQTAIKAFFAMVSALVLGMLLPAFLTFFRTLLANPMTWVILALVALAAVIEDLIVWMEGGESALDDFWKALFGSPEEAKQLFEDIKKAVIQFVDESIPKLQEFGQDIKDLVQDIKDLWQEISDSTPWKMFYHNMLEARRAEAQDADELNKLIAKAKSDGHGGTFDDHGGMGGGFEANPIADSIRNAINDARESLNGIWDGLQETLSNAWGSIVEALNNGWKAFIEFGEEILNDISKFAEDTFESIRKFFEDAMKACEKAISDFSSAANSAISGLNSPINALASNIRTNLIGAIDEASARWRAFQQEMAIQASIPMPVGGGGYSNTTNNNSSSYNINGPITVKTDSPGNFTRSAWLGAGYQQSNGGGM